MISSAIGAQTSSASFVSLGYLHPGENDSKAVAVSADGTWLVGTSRGNVDFKDASFRWSAATGFQALGTPPGKTEFSAWGISADGRFIIGESSRLGYRWEAGVGFVNLGTLLGIDDVSPWGISGDGSIVVGGMANTTIPPGDENGDPFRWTAGTGMVSLGELPGATAGEALAISQDGQVIVGWSGNFAFRRDRNGVMTSLGVLPGYNQSIARGVSSNGTVIVGECYASDPFRTTAFRWTQAGGMQNLTALPGSKEVSAEAVSGDGATIVGYRADAFFGLHAFIWDGVNGMRDLQDVLSSQFGIVLSGWTLSDAAGISADGNTIVGSGINPQGQHEAWVGRLNSTAAVAPGIHTEPVGGGISVGGNFTFSVGVSGSWPLNFQWRKSGTNIIGETNAILTISNAQVSHNGVYSVTASNSAGSIMSANATLTVNAPTVLGRLPIGNKQIVQEHLASLVRNLHLELIAQDRAPNCAFCMYIPWVTNPLSNGWELVAKGTSQAVEKPTPEALVAAARSLLTNSIASDPVVEYFQKYPKRNYVYHLSCEITEMPGDTRNFAKIPSWTIPFFWIPSFGPFDLEQDAAGKWRPKLGIAGRIALEFSYPPPQHVAIPIPGIAWVRMRIIQNGGVQAAAHGISATSPAFQGFNTPPFLSDPSSLPTRGSDYFMGGDIEYPYPYPYASRQDQLLLLPMKYATGRYDGYLTVARRTAEGTGQLLRFDLRTGARLAIDIDPIVIDMHRERYQTPRGSQILTIIQAFGEPSRDTSFVFQWSENLTNWQEISEIDSAFKSAVPEEGRGMIGLWPSSRLINFYRVRYP